uniref:Uncharacterized protein n=1 Tax=Anguilla anguilla TaxID=7936 RepID=A0A0E9V750_ANGAN
MYKHDSWNKHESYNFPDFKPWLKYSCKLCNISQNWFCYQ